LALARFFARAIWSRLEDASAVIFSARERGDLLNVTMSTAAAANRHPFVVLVTALV
jgi:hypothetical protein